MKRFLMITALLLALVAVVSGTALADDPVTPTCPCGEPGAGAGPGDGSGYGPRGGAGNQPGGGPLGGGQRGGPPAWAGGDADVADVLGMSADELHSQRLAGRSLVEVAAAQGMDKETLVGRLLAARKVELDRLVAAGTLTQERADSMAERMQTQVAAMVERTATGPAMNQGQKGPRQGAQRPGLGAGRMK